MPDRIFIKHPGSGNTGNRAVPKRFIAAGTAKGNTIHHVKGTITRLDENNSPVTNPVLNVTRFEGQQLFFVKKPHRDTTHRWMIYFNIPPEWKGMYRLDVVGYDSDNGVLSETSDDVDVFEVLDRDRYFEPAAKGDTPLDRITVEIGYPPSNHVVSGAEREYFVAYGTTDELILSAEIKFDATTLNKAADTVYDNLTINFWSAQFSDLTSLEPQQILEVIDASDFGTIKYVKITN